MRCGLMTSTAVFLLGTGLGLAQASPPAPVPVRATGQVTSSEPISAPVTQEPVTVISPTPATPLAQPIEGETPSGFNYEGTEHPDLGPVTPGTLFYVNGEYLLWRYRGNLSPDLEGALTGTGIDANLVANTLPLDSWHSGARAMVGLWMDPSHTLGFEVGGFFLEKITGSFDTTISSNPATTISSIPSKLILQPVNGGLIDVPNSTGVVDSPLGGPNGTVDLDPSDTLTSHFKGISSSRLWGTEANVRSTRLFLGATSFDFLAGFRNLNLDESLRFTGDYSFMEPPALGDADETPTNTEDGRTNTMHTLDSLSTHNHFYGAQVGASFETVWGRFIVNGYGKFAAGGTCETVTLMGSTHLDPAMIEQNAGGAVIARPARDLPGGLITPPVAGGITTHSTRASVIPELNANVGYQLTSGLRAYVGYNYMLWTNVARVGDQSVSSSTSKTSNLNLQGLDFGLQFRY